MASAYSTLQNSIPQECNDDYEDVNMILTVVVKRRKAIPTKCMEINKQIFAFELQRLENANIDTEEDYDEKEKLRKIIQGFKGLQYFQLSLDDLREAEKKLENGYKRIKEINLYLQKRKKLN